jgi:hypothetical protein
VLNNSAVIILFLLACCISLDLITLTTFGEEYAKRTAPSHANFFFFLLIRFVLCPNVLRATFSSSTHILCSKELKNLPLRAFNSFSQKKNCRSSARSGHLGYISIRKTRQDGSRKVVLDEQRMYFTYTEICDEIETSAI